MTKPIPHAPPATRPQFTQEPGFITADLAQAGSVAISSRSPGLLAFLYVEGDKETVVKILMCDNLAKCFVDNRHV